MRYISKIVASVLLVCMLLMLLPVSAEAAETKVNLSSMHTEKSSYYEVVTSEDGITDSYGNNYKSNIVKFDASESGYARYDLNGAYTSFTGTIVASDRTGSGASINVGIFADGKKVYSLTDYTRQKAGEKFSIDLTGVRTLEIKTSNSGSYSYGWIFMVNSALTKIDTPKEYTNWAGLGELVVIDSREYKDYATLMMDSFGDVHNGCQYLDASNNAYVLYNLNKQYITLKGAIVTGARTGSGASMTVKIYCDDKLVFSESDITRQKPLKAFSIDVSNVQVLKIETSNEGSYSYGWVYIVDDILSTHQHTLGEWIVEEEATCTEKGKQIVYCTDCGELVKTETIDAIGHTPEDNWLVVEEATCTRKGKEIQNCAVCGEQAKQQSIDMLEHKSDGTWIVTTEADCHAEGERIQNCAACGKELLAEAIPVTDHNFGSWITVSGSIWNAPIVKERSCSICGDVESKEDNSTSWLKPLVTVLIVIMIGGVAVLGVTLHMNGLPLHPSSIQQLFKKETLTDEDIDEILNKQDPVDGDSC